MDFNLDRTTRINYSPEYQGLYKWCLAEFDKEGNQLGRDQIPWDLSLYFVGHSLKVFTSISNESDEAIGPRKKTSISGKLQPGFYRDAENLTEDVRYSFFGTNREIKNFSFSIRETVDGEAESCSLTAIPEYETNLDFDNWTEEDFVGFDLKLERDKFRELVATLEARAVDSVWLRVNRVAGIYSEWTPDITTYRAKILSRFQLNSVEGIDEDRAKPLVAGMVGEYDFQFVTLTKLLAKQELPTTDSDITKDPDEIGEDEDYDTVALKDSYSIGQQSFEHATSLILKMAHSLKFPLWCIFGVLVLLLLK